jgi:hypothetical protein
MGTEEGEEMQAKEMHNIFNKIITENFSNLEKSIPIQQDILQEASRTPNRPDQNISTPQHIIIKTTNEGFQDGSFREEAESMPPKVKSWRDAGDTPNRKNH